MIRTMINLNKIKCYKCMTRWWFQPLWKIWKSIGMGIPNIWNNGKMKKMFQTANQMILWLHCYKNTIPLKNPGEGEVPNFSPQIARWVPDILTSYKFKAVQKQNPHVQQLHEQTSKPKKTRMLENRPPENTKPQAPVVGQRSEGHVYEESGAHEGISEPRQVDKGQHGHGKLITR